MADIDANKLSDSNEWTQHAKTSCVLIYARLESCYLTPTRGFCVSSCQAVLYALLVGHGLVLFACIECTHLWSFIFGPGLVNHAHGLPKSQCGFPSPIPACETPPYKFLTSSSILQSGLGILDRFKEPKGSRLYGEQGLSPFPDLCSVPFPEYAVHGNAYSKLSSK